MQKKIKKAKRKVNKTNVAAIIVSVIALLGIVCLCAGLGVILSLLKDKPKLDINDFNPQESSIVYDRNDNQIYELGSVIRQNVEYDDIPQSLVDAFVAVEDSRFFEHNGFDLPRFAKAFLTNLKTLSFSQGGSTFTMQLVKNTYFVSDEQGTGAVKSIKRKVQEIALSLELEKISNKKEIFKNYLNKLNFGGTNQNIRGVQKAAQYYFGKDVKDLSLEESAMLAGVVNAPNLYNPFLHLDYAQERRDEVLYLMNYHGYISDDEYKLALATKVENFLQDSTNNTNRGEGNGTPYQAYVDAVVSEVFNLTGLDPYNTSMRIHTYMDPDIQTLMDDIQAGKVDDAFEYPDDEFEVASICVDNDTGEVIGILGGRNYADGGALLLNHATDQYKQPGSSIKPILVYSQAFEVLGWATSHAVVDRPLVYEGTNYIISNATGNYAGQVTLKYAVAESLNTPAIQAIRELIKAKGNTYLVDYLNAMDFNVDLQDFDEQYAIGGKGMMVSCEQLAGAYAMLMNNGYYTKPHTIRKIEFLNEKAPVEPAYTSKQVISEQACFLMSELLRNNVEGHYGNLMDLFDNDDYRVYAKTGTTNWGVEGAQFNVPNGSIKDGWVAASTKDYTVATWMGYEKGQKDKPSYMTYTIYNKNIKGKITKMIHEKVAEKYGFAKDVQKPTGITSIGHIIGTFPYAAPIANMDSQYVTSGYIKSDSKYANLVSPQSAKVESMNSDPKISLSGTTLSIEWPEYPDSSQLASSDHTMDISLLKSDGSVLIGARGAKLFDYSWAFGPIKYKADVYISNKQVTSVVSDDNTKTVDLSGDLSGSAEITVKAYYGYENGANSDVKSAKVTAKTDLTINLPNKGVGAQAMKTALESYGVPVTMNATPDPNAEDDTIISVSISDPNARDITSLCGSSIDTYKSLLKGFTINYYSKTYSISLEIEGGGSTLNTTVGSKLYVKANTSYTGSIGWSVNYDGEDGGEVSYSTTTISDAPAIQFETFTHPGTYTIEASIPNATTAKAIITVTGTE